MWYFEQVLLRYCNLVRRAFLPESLENFPAQKQNEYGEWTLEKSELPSAWLPQCVRYFKLCPHDAQNFPKRPNWYKALNIAFPQGFIVSLGSYLYKSLVTHLFVLKRWIIRWHNWQVAKNKKVIFGPKTVCAVTLTSLISHIHGVMVHPSLYYTMGWDN